MNEATRRVEQGFTLIELMIVVAIVGILAAVALPMYQDYSKRAKLSEVVLAAAGCRTAVAELYQSRTVSQPPGANGWGCEFGAGTSNATVASRYVSGVTTSDDGLITVTAQGFGDTSVDGKKVTLLPLINPATPAVFATGAGHALFGWRCGSPGDGTNMPAKYLPSSCRG